MKKAHYHRLDMKTTTRRDALPIGGLGVAGAVAAHALTYAVAAPGASGALLAATGHGYWESAIALAVAGGVLAATALFMQRAFRRDAYVPLSPHRFGATLALTQCMLFTLVEIVERVVNGTALSSLTTGGVLVRGLLFQLCVAVVMTVVVAAISGAAERTRRVLARVRTARPPLARIATPCALATPLSTISFCGSNVLVRGPPSR